LSHASLASMPTKSAPVASGRKPGKIFRSHIRLDKPAIARPITQRGRCSVGICASCLLHGLRFCAMLSPPCRIRQSFDTRNVLEVTRLSFVRQQIPTSGGPSFAPLSVKAPKKTPRRERSWS
jgi:hypothetical protein